MNVRNWVHSCQYFSLCFVNYTCIKVIFQEDATTTHLCLGAVSSLAELCVHLVVTLGSPIGVIGLSDRASLNLNKT